MPLRYQFVRGIPQISQQRYTGFCLNGFLQHLSMTCSPNTISNDSYNVYLGIKMLKSHHHRGCTARHCTCIYHQHDRGPQYLCHLGSTANLACAAKSIIEPHDPFNHSDISRGSSSTKNLQHTAWWHHPGIEAIAGLRRGNRSRGRIDIIRPNFEWLYPYTSRA